MTWSLYVLLGIYVFGMLVVATALVKEHSEVGLYPFRWWDVVLCIVIWPAVIVAVGISYLGTRGKT